MNESRKILIGSVLALGIVIGLTAMVWSTQDIQEEKNKTYKNFLESLNSSVKSFRLGGDFSLKNENSYYSSLVGDENFADQHKLNNLDNQISQAFKNMTGENAEVSVDDMRTLKSKVSEMASEMGVGIPFIFRNAVLVILLFSISLAFLATVLCREMIGWESYMQAEDSVRNWKAKIQDAKRGKSKKKRKLEFKDEEFKHARTKLWVTDIKQASFYIIFLVLFLALFNFIYGDWTVAWIPFNWFSSGLLRSIGVSLTFFGWFIFSYFGFAYLWREIVLSGK